MELKGHASSTARYIYIYISLLYGEYLIRFMKVMNRGNGYEFKGERRKVAFSKQRPFA
jgi:hypothetical protein